MNATTVIPTDLVTPLGAYLRMRPEDGAAFLLESVEHGRLGRHSFLGFGTRIVRGDPVEVAERLDGPLTRLEAGRNGTGGRTRRSPGRFEYVRGVERAK